MKFSLTHDWITHQAWLDFRKVVHLISVAGVSNASADLGAWRAVISLHRNGDGIQIGGAIDIVAKTSRDGPGNAANTTD